MPKTILGVVEPFFETGSEGVIWSVQDDTLDENGHYTRGYDGLHIIEQGDHLTIYNHDGSVAFQDFIAKDTTTGYEQYPHNPRYGQQVSNGMWVHWIQVGWSPDAWGALFMETPPRRARLERSQ